MNSSDMGGGMPCPSDFLKQVSDAYAHLHDLVFLRTHPLRRLLIADPSLAPRESAWRLHSLLIEAIEELKPGPDVAMDSWEWLRYKLLHSYYLAGRTPRSIAAEMAISERHFYRLAKRALAGLAELLWEQVQASVPRAVSAEEMDTVLLRRLELLRSEAERLYQSDQQTDVREIIEGMAPLLHTLARQCGARVSVEIPGVPPLLVTQRDILRQIVLGLWSYLTHLGEIQQIRLEVTGLGDKVCFRLACQRQSAGQNRELAPAPDMSHAPGEEERSRLSVIQELVALQGASLYSLPEQGGYVGFELILPTVQQRTILVVDDNEDILHMFRRYLSGAGYQVVTARTGAEALRLAEEVQPHVITLDVMMANQDGWGVLQSLSYHPRLKQIPVLVCTILPERELAIALGAASFLVKPVSQQDLLSALQALETNFPPSSSSPLE